MDSLKSEFRSILGDAAPFESLGEGGNGEIHIRVADGRFTEAVRLLAERGVVLIGLFCVEGFRQHKGLTILYVFEKRGYSSIVILERRVGGSAASSIATLFPSAAWYEREAMDGFGVEFPDALDKRRLLLHEEYPAQFHPFSKALSKGAGPLPAKGKGFLPYAFKRMEGEGVYEIPVGPVHAGIIEPGHFRFSVIGETVFNLEIRLFYKHRGIERLAEGKTAQECVRLAEAISGDESAANAAAFCMAAEAVADIKVPRRALALRTVFLELERMYALLGDLAGMVVDIAYPVGASQFFILREELLRQNERLTGSRFLKGALAVGGLEKDVPAPALAELAAYLQPFAARFKRARDAVLSRPSVMDRFETTGVVRKELVGPLNLTGPIARASGAAIDTRADHPYGMYPALMAQKRTHEEGDVLARFKVKAAEVLDSAGMVRRLLEEMPPGMVRARSGGAGDGHALALVESPRGQNLHWLLLKGGKVVRYKVRTASFCNWQAIEHAVPGNIVPDFPLINKSLNLSYAGTDL